MKTGYVRYRERGRHLGSAYPCVFRLQFTHLGSVRVYDIIK